MSKFTSLTFTALLLAASAASADTIILRNGSSYSGHLMGEREARLAFQDNQGVQMQFPFHDVQSVTFGPYGATVSLRNGRTYQGQLSGPEANTLPFVDNQGISYQFPTGEVSSLVISENWGGPYRANGPGLVLPAGSEISVVSSAPIDSRNARPGQTFPALITQDVMSSDGRVVIPRDSPATLLLRSESAGGIHQGDVVLDLDSVTINGVMHRIASTDVVKTSGGNSGRRTAAFLGGGAALGALIGAIAGGGKGAAIGAGAGAGAGGIAEISTHGHRVFIPAETTLTFELDQPLVLSPYRGGPMAPAQGGYPPNQYPR
jgi:hypothetical protein